MPQPTTQPPTLPGTNLTPGELLRLILLLCIPPWLFAAGLFWARLASLPTDALGWIVTIAAGPAAWGAFISAVADGRTLLGRAKPAGAAKRRLWQVIRTAGGAYVGGSVHTAGGDFVGRDQVQVIHVQGDLVTTAAAEPKADPKALRQAYLSRVLQQTQTLQLAGVDPKTAQDQTARTGLALAAVYTALMTQQSAPEKPVFSEKTGFSLDRERPRLSAVALLNRERLLALLGDPGSGKTTFVNFVALCLAGEALNHPEANLALLTTPLPQEQNRPSREDKPEPQPWQHGALLPVRVVLRDLAARGLPPVGERATGDHLWRFIAAELGETLADYASHLKRELRERGGLILLDGLDEVPQADDRRGQVKQIVMGFAADFPRCRFLVTSRTYAY